MKNSLITALCILAAGFCIAQTINDTDTNRKEVIIGDVPVEKLPQRHPTADLVLRILNVNSERQDVVIKYEEIIETGIYANELQQELVRSGMKVTLQPSKEALATYTGKYVNCSYEITDSAFVILVYPQKKQ